MVTVHIKPTAPYHTTVFTALVKKIQLPLLLHVLFLLDYQKTWPKMEPWPKVEVLLCIYINYIFVYIHYIISKVVGQS